jgi:murein DD-endopeptidase MepM/ murein hydrolase activator NlpD
MSKRILVFIILAGALAGLGFYLYRSLRPSATRSLNVLEWLRHLADHPQWAVQAGTRCGNAPFLLPTNGFIGYLWDDSFKLGHRHQGIDIFAGTGVDETPVVAAYPGYLTRLPEWKSSLIVRLPEDPLQPGRQIWVYYTHMADSAGNSFISTDFPAGTTEKYIEAGTLLGYQGNFSGDPNNPVGVHLHFSIVKDDGQGHFLNELEISNTLDPSPYLGIPLYAGNYDGSILTCQAPVGN